MQIMLCLIRSMLSAVFCVASLAKLRDLAGTRKAVIDFGLPAILAGPTALVLPVVELGIAIALLPAPTSWWATVAACLLLLIFTAIIAINLARGRKPDCHCFGQLKSEPIGVPTIIRNVVLISAAAFVAWIEHTRQSPSLFDIFSGLTPAQGGIALVSCAVVCVLVVEAWFIVHLARQNGRLLLRLEALEARLDASGGMAAIAPSPGLPVGAAAPSFQLPDVTGKTLSLDNLRAEGKSILLLFVDPQCGPCKTLAPDIIRWRTEQSQLFSLVLVSRGKPDDNRVWQTGFGNISVLLQHEREVSESFRISATPGAVLIRPDGTVGSTAAMGVDAIRTMIEGRDQEQERGSHSLPEGNGNGHLYSAVSRAPVVKRIGEPAPSIRLPDLTGRTVDLMEFHGQPVLVVFWNPNCGYCKRMLSELKSWEAERPLDAPRLFVVSTGSVEENRAMGLQATVVLDSSFSTGQKFGTMSTPSAVLIDREGRIASSVYVGASEVLRLAGTRQPPQMIA